jgi:type I restriction enzyme M protein
MNLVERCLVRVNEYFLSQFASAEGRKARDFYTPHCVSDPRRNSGPYKDAPSIPLWFRACRPKRKFVEAHGTTGNISVYARIESDEVETCQDELAVHGIEANLGTGTAIVSIRMSIPITKRISSFAYLRHLKYWGGKHLSDDVRCEYAVPPEGNSTSHGATLQPSSFAD